MSGGIRRFVISHPNFNSSVSFPFNSVVPTPIALLQNCRVLRLENTTCRLQLINFGSNFNALVVRTNASLAGLDFSSDNRVATMQGQPLIIDSSTVFVTVTFPPASFRQQRSQVLWFVTLSSLQATFILTIEASGMPFLSSVSPAAISAYGGVPVSLFVSGFALTSTAKNWFCYFPFGNVTADSVSQNDASSVTVVCRPPSNFQALSASSVERSCRLHYTIASTSFLFSFELQFMAPIKPTLSFLDDGALLNAQAAAVIVRNPAPFTSNAVIKMRIDNRYQVPIRNLIIRSDKQLLLQFSINCGECKCCSGSAVSLTVSNSDYQQMTAIDTVYVTDPNAVSVSSVSPSVLASSGGEKVEIQLKNFPRGVSSLSVTVKIGSADPVTAYQVDDDKSGLFSTIRLFSPSVPKGNAGFIVSIDGKQEASVVSNTELSFPVVDLILSGHCTPSSVPAFGNTKSYCYVKNLPFVSGQLEFSYVNSKSKSLEVLATSKDLEFTDLGASLLLVELNLPNVASKIVDRSNIKLQILNKNFASLIFSYDLEVLPSPPVIQFVDPLSGPNNQATDVVAYVEYFQGSLSAVEALLDGTPMTRGSFYAEDFDVSTSIFYFTLPRALKDGLHTVSFWSGDSAPLSFSFTALDVTPRLRYMFPTEGSTKGGDSVSIMFENFEGVDAISLGTSRVDDVFVSCFMSVCVLSAILPPSSDAALKNVTLLSGNAARFILPQQFQTIAPVPRLDVCYPTIGLVSGGTAVSCNFLDVQNSESLTRANVTARFDTSTGQTTGVVTVGSSFTVNLLSPASLFEGSISISVSIGSLSFSHPFRYVRPCNFESFCPSSGLIPNDLKIL
jgi:hypothetical protein